MVPFEKKMKSEDTDISHKMFQDSIKLADINNRKRYELKDYITETKNDKSSCTLTRYNGFKGEMPKKPGQWQLL